MSKPFQLVKRVEDGWELVTKEWELRDGRLPVYRRRYKVLTFTEESLDISQAAIMCYLEFLAKELQGGLR